jgi:hypothetical protein
MITFLRHMVENKDFYAEHPDRIWEKRFASPFPIRKYAHTTQYEAILAHVKAGEIGFGFRLRRGCYSDYACQAWDGVHGKRFVQAEYRACAMSWQNPKA